MEQDIISELMDDNKPTRRQKTKQGILVSFRVIVLGLVSFLTFFLTNWRKEAEAEADRKARKDTADMVFKQTIVNQLSLITALNVNRDQDLKEIKEKVDRIMETKADREDLRRLEYRIDHRLGEQLINNDSSSNQVDLFTLNFRPNFKKLTP